MADRTKIEWTDATWNPIVGCSVLSPGCTNCYAMRLAGTRLRHHPSRAGLTQPSKAGPVWTGETRLDEKALMQPLHWRSPRKIFVCAHSDLFHEATPDAWIDRIFAVMALCPQHTFQMLTKRPERMRTYLTGPGMPRRVAQDALRVGADLPLGHPGWTRSNWTMGRPSADVEPAVWPLRNIWLGVTAERQQEADERIPILLATPAAKRFVSVEPMLGPVYLRRITVAGGWYDALSGWRDIQEPFAGLDETLDWVICGGESGPGARPMHPDWVRSLRYQCAAAGVAFLFKQWGEWAPQPLESSRARDMLFARDDGRFGVAQTGNGDSEEPIFLVGKAHAGRLLDGVEHNSFPEG